MARLPHLGVATLLGVVILAVPLAGHAQEDADLAVAVRDSAFAADGSVELVVNVTGSAKPAVLETEAFLVTENDADVGELEVEPLLETEGPEVAVSLLIDVSGSMAGEPMDLTREAASSLVEQLSVDGIDVGVLTFGDGVTELTPPTDDTELLVELVGGIEAGGFTSLYDAVIAGAEQLAGIDGQRNLVVFSDGGDTSSEAPLDEALAAVEAVEAPVVVVAFETDDLDPDALDAIAGATDGRVLTTEEVDGITEQFEEVAADLASQYVLRYTADDHDSSELDVTVGIGTDEANAAASFTVPNPREEAETATPPAVTIRPAAEPGPLSGDLALGLGLATAFAAAALLLVLMLTGQRSTGDRVLSEQLSRYLERGDRRAGRSGLVASHFRERAMALMESSPKPRGFDDRLTLRLEQAAWPLRNGEFLWLSLLGGVGAGLVIGVLTNWGGGVILGLVAASIPWLVLEVRRSRRQDAFLRQLPDTLQLMAGSLRAGYGVLQAIDTVAKEASSPTSEEFQRVITEARLGMPVEDALEAMADRIGSEEFRWVVLAINIQREVGGNLAELLDTVGETLREREALRRQIKILSAEGRLSAMVLIALPFVLVAYLITIRPEYIATLVTSGLFGWAMVIGASVLMAIGILWIRKMIRIEV